MTIKRIRLSFGLTPRAERHLDAMFWSAVVIVALIGLLMICNGCGGVTPPTAQSTIPRSGTVFLGDSIIGRWDLDSSFPGKGYVNGGWFGHKTFQTASDLAAVLDGTRVCHGYIPDPGNPPDPSFPFSCQSIPPPSRIVLLIGWNDLFAGLNPNVAAANIDAITRQSRAAGVDVVLVTLYRFDSAHPATWMTPWDSCSAQFPYRDSEPIVNTGIRSTAQELHLPMVDLESLFTCQSDYTIDGVHPNASGYAQMTTAVTAALVSAK